MARRRGGRNVVWSIVVIATACALSSERSLVFGQAEHHVDRFDFAAARQDRTEALARLRKEYGPDHWKVTDARLAIEDLEQLATMTADKRRKLADAERSSADIFSRFEAGKYREALAPAKRVLALRQEALGERHHLCAESESDLAAVLQATGDLGAAREHYERALAIRTAVLGEHHPDTASTLSDLGIVLVAERDFVAARPRLERALAIRMEDLPKDHADIADSLKNLASLFKSQGDFAAARPLLERAVEIRESMLGDKDLEFAVSLNNLALLLQEQGDYAAAKPRFLQAIQIAKDRRIERHPTYAAMVDNLAQLLAEEGDFAAALPLCKQALAIRKNAGERTAPYASSLDSLARMTLASGDSAAALSLFKRALQIRKQVLGENHPVYASSLNNLAHVLKLQFDYAAARPLYEQALAIGKAANGERRPEYAKALDALGQLLRAEGDFEAARPKHEEALAIRKGTLHELHPAYAASLSNMGFLLWAQRDYTGAASYLNQALEIDRSNLELAAATQSERQQLAMTQAHRGRLDAYLSIALLARQPACDAYRHLLASKGAVFDRQQRLRAQRRRFQGDPGSVAAKRFAEYEQTVKELAASALAAPDRADTVAWRDKLNALARRKDELEAELARLDSGFRTDRAIAGRTPLQLQADLPGGTALVDLLVYNSFARPATGKGEFQRQKELVAFVVRPDRPIGRVDLGPITPIAQAIDAWRPVLIGRAAPPSANESAGVLRRLIWTPLEPHLDGIATVLLSPDGPIGLVPLAALPGHELNGYLIEERAIAIVPVPRLLGLGTSSTTTSAGSNPGGVEATPEALLAGDINYGGEPGTATDRGGSRSAAIDPRAGFRPDFKPLRATRAEIVKVASAFEARFPKGRAQMISGDLATEDSIRRLAQSARFLHLATHAYFAPAELRSALLPGPAGLTGASDDPLGGAGLAGYHPGLLSGIALAGASRRPTPIGHEDGILTALEVAELDLRAVELAVLSACETGLGEVAGGEGLLSLQRAFQIAGAHSVVASLWTIGDEPTSVLMARFYENLWRKGQTPAVALRGAQLAMLRGELWGGAAGQPGRGLTPLDDASHSNRLPPFYWAAFVLSTDRP